MNPQPPPFPHAEIRAAVGDHPEGSAALDALTSQLSAPSADPAAVREHVGSLQRIPEAAHVVENWFELPATQHWLQVLSNIGL